MSPHNRHQPELAFIYDFDGTLLHGNTMDYSLLPALGVASDKEIAKFWDTTNKLAQREDADRVCIYMHELARLARQRNVPLTANSLRAHGEKLPLHEGLMGDNNWFARMGKLCADADLAARHYVVSSGLREIIDGCPIRNEFEKCFASRYLYDGDGKAMWPAQMINYTNKTQYLFRINKGKLKTDSDNGPNEYMPERERPVPFSRMVFFGDGETDVPCFSLVKRNGGHAIAVLNGSRQAHARRTIENLVGDNRVDSISLGDHFAPDGRMERQMIRVIGNIRHQLS